MCDVTVEDTDEQQVHIEALYAVPHEWHEDKVKPETIHDTATRMRLRSDLCHVEDDEEEDEGDTELK